MRRFGIVVAGSLVAALTATSAFAAKIIQIQGSVTDGNFASSLTGATLPHFHGGLLVTFKGVGLGNNELTTYQVTADASATYGCVNNGDHHPNAANKETVTGPVSSSATFTSDKNGQVQGAIAVAPLGPGSFDCPAGQTMELISVSYTNVVVTDLTHGVSVTLPGTFSLSFF